MGKLFTLFVFAICVSSCANAQAKIPVSQAGKHYGETITICDKMVGDALILDSKTKNVLLTMGSGSNQKLKVMVPAEIVKKFLNTSINNGEKTFCITGKVTDLNGQPELVVLNVGDIKLCNPTLKPLDIKPNDFMKFE